MPTPLELLLNPVALVIISMFALLFVWESLFPGRELPKIRFWKVRGIVFFLVYFYLSSYLPMFWDSYLAGYQLFNLSHLGLAEGTVVGILVYELIGYNYHRLMHRSDFMWRTFHQVHHSSERLDTPSAFNFSPLDMIGWTMVGSLSFVLVIGLTPEASTLAMLIITFLAIFQHANIKTPQWLGYIVQRPESHTVHHGKGIHHYNYADLPVFDMIFGTFRNPATYENETGFYEGASSRLIPMLLFKDISSNKNRTNPTRNKSVSSAA